MTFRVRLASRLMLIVFFTAFLGVIYSTGIIHTIFHTSRLVELLILTGVFAVLVVYSLYYTEIYIINDGILTIKKGSNVSIYKISEINHIYYKTFNKGSRMMSININEAHLVIGEQKISVNTGITNKDSKSVVDVLNKKYYKRIVYDNSLIK